MAGMQDIDRVESVPTQEIGGDRVRGRQALDTEMADRIHAQSLLSGERVVLESIARGQPLQQTLEALARFIQAMSEGVLCSILLLDRDGIHLRHGAAPSLPDAYNQAIDGLVIGPAVGSCGTAAYRETPVTVSDIAADPLWADYRDLALAHGLRACWSTPVRSSGGEVLGTFALYYTEPMEPRPEERSLIDVLTYLAGIAIERHRREEERAELLEREHAARTAAEEALRVRDEFLSIASHELRTPVTVVKGVAQMLQRSARRDHLEPGYVTQQLETIVRAGDRLTLLVNDLLDVSRVERGQLVLRPENLDLAPLLREVVERQAQQLDGEHHIEADVPDRPIPVHADAGRLEQVFDNLLSNAVKYSPDGGAIEVALRADPGGVTVSVRDQGIGLPDGAEERIFEPFGRAENAVTSHFPGMGLGLYVSRHIAELHGGRLWAQSDGEGLGTTVRLWLPLSGPPAQP